MRFAPEGIREMLFSTLVLGVSGCAAWVWFWPAAIPIGLVWIWSIAFFRDPRRVSTCAPDELCSPADGTIQDVTRLDHYHPIEGPAVRVGIFLSLFNAHINRAPCTGRVRSVEYRPGKFLAAMNPAAGEVNESNTLVIDRPGGWPGPVVVRQIAGMAARRIVCHARAGTSLAVGQRFGLIKFGSRTELILPATAEIEILVKVGDKVRAGLTPLIRQPVANRQGTSTDERECKAPQRPAAASA